MGSGHFSKTEMIVFMTNHNLTSKEIADKINNTDSNFSLKLNGKRKFSLDDYWNFKKAFVNECDDINQEADRIFFSDSVY